MTSDRVRSRKRAAAGILLGTSVAVAALAFSAGRSLFRIADFARDSLLRRFASAEIFFPQLRLGTPVAFAAAFTGQQEMTTPAQRHPKLMSQLADLAEAVSQERGPVSRRAQRTAVSSQALPKSARDGMHGRTLKINERGDVQVYIRLDSITHDKLQQLEVNGAVIEVRSQRAPIVQAGVRVNRLDAIADLPFVRFVRTPSYAVRLTGSVNTEGDSILSADQVRSQLGVTGSGVRVGVISDGIKGIFATGCTSCGPAAGSPISTGDLPNATGTRDASGRLITVTGGISAKSFISNTPPSQGGSGESPDLEGQDVLPPNCAFPGAGAEGTALLEIIHDIAPDAKLAFANADTDLEFNAAVNFLAQNNDVAMDDFGFYGLPYNGTSDVSTNTAAALNSSSNRLRAYVTAVGNSSQGHYLSVYADSGVDGTSIGVPAGHLHLFQGNSTTTDVLGLGTQAYDQIELTATGEVVIFLEWDDPFGGSTNNYDLYLVDHGTGKVVASSTTVQNGTQDPVEVIDYVDNLSGTLQNPDKFEVIIQNVGNKAAAKNLNLYLFGPECAPAGPLELGSTHAQHNYNTLSNSVPAESDAGGSPVSVISTGAICSGSTAALSLVPDTCNDPNHDVIEFYSSQGPTLDGRLKPDVSSIDGVSITGAGSFGSPFFGTSAATPHVAAIAALLLQTAPCLLTGSSGARDAATARSNLRGLILNNAVDLGAPGPDDVFGYGRINALASAQHAIPTTTGVTSLTVSGISASGASISADQLGFGDPDSCPLSLDFSGGCGSGSGSSVTCPLGNSTMTVSATNNSVTKSAPATVQVTVTKFTLKAASASSGSGTVKAGSDATYQVTITPQIGPFTNAVALSCSNLPSLSTCAFSPSSVTPGAAPTGSSLTIKTTANSIVPGGFHHLRFPPLPSGWPAWLLISALMLAFAGSLLFRPLHGRRTLAAMLLVLFAVTLAAVEMACSGSSSSGGGMTTSTGTPPGAYTITISGTSGSLVESTTAILTVQ